MRRFKVGDKVIPTKKAKHRLYGNKNIKYDSISIKSIQKRNNLSDLLTLNSIWDAGFSVYIDAEWVILDTKLSRILYDR